MLLDRDIIGQNVLTDFPPSGVFLSDFVSISLDLLEVSAVVCGICLYHSFGSYGVSSDVYHSPPDFSCRPFN